MKVRLVETLRWIRAEKQAENASLKARSRPRARPTQVYKMRTGCSICLYQDTKMVDGLGGEIWPGAYHLCDFIEREIGEKGMRGKRVLELGSGCGLVGIMCAKMGADVILTDEFIDLCKINIKAATARECCGSVLAKTLAWGYRQDLELPFSIRFDYIVGSDITYDKTLHSLLLESIIQLMSVSNGMCECLLSMDLDTQGTRLFNDMAEQHFEITHSEPKTYAYCVQVAQRSGNHAIDYLEADDEHYSVFQFRPRSASTKR